MTDVRKKDALREKSIPKNGGGRASPTMQACHSTAVPIEDYAARFAS